MAVGTRESEGTGMSTAPANWLISAEPDPPTVTPDWEAVGPSIEGVAIREVRHVVTDDGVLTEVFRAPFITNCIIS